MHLRCNGKAVLVLVSAFAGFGLACSERPPSGPAPFLGAWRNADARDTITLRFLNDGTVSIAITNPQVDYSFTASWQRLDSNRIRFTAPAGLPDFVLPRRAVVRFAIAHDSLTFSGGASSITYERAR
jgi:hypothetical protein